MRVRKPGLSAEAELYELAMECANSAHDLSNAAGTGAALAMIGYTQLAHFYLNAIQVAHNNGFGVPD